MIHVWPRQGQAVRSSAPLDCHIKEVVRRMKRTFTLMLALAVCVVPVAGAQNGAQDGALIAQVKDYLRSETWRFEPVEGAAALRMRYEGQQATWTVLMHAREDLRRLSFYSVLPEAVPEPRRAAVAEYLHRANFDLALGCFELDYDTGRVRFRTSLDVEGAQLSQAQIRNYLYTNVLTCERYLPGLLQVIEAETGPAEAIAAIERTGEEPEAEPAEGQE
jgi:hypothetical protein